MAVKIISELETICKKINSQYLCKSSSGRLRLGLSGYSQLLLYSFLFSYPSFSYAGPAGGNIVGGAGHIHVSGLTTDIHQNSASLAINWESYNLSANEVVNYLQPGASSIALNRILSNSGSQILGQINANGQVVLVNPNGIFFGATASVNVGGLIASGLDIKPTDFMNSDYVFSSIDGTSGAVINGGILKASLGGSISLLGTQVSNTGLISANLGAVNLAAGNEAVLTFDNEGLMGVKITRAVLQDELGVDPAILNSGEISAESGRVLLTASQSQDVFSQAVNRNGIEQATSVVVNADGSFTLGGGADVVNTGVVDVAAISEDAGQIVVLGENVSSSGTLKADSINGNGGEIELHATDTTLLTENSVTSARSENNGKGGVIKILGNKVGLFDQSTVDVSGADGGGQALMGGDRQGQNNLIRNADFIYLGENTTVKSNALDNGNGGKIITFANDTAKIHGDLFSRGGLNGGNGGFIETSGLKGFQITSAPDISSPFGLGGEWLIDPNNIRIVAGNANDRVNDGLPLTVETAFETTGDDAILGVDLIVAALAASNASVTVTTGAASPDSELGNITFEALLDFDGIKTSNKRLTLNAANDIIFMNDTSITDSNPDTADSLSINLYARGDITLNDGVVIKTRGGDFTVGDIANNIIPDSFSSFRVVNDVAETAIIDTSGMDVVGNNVVPATDAGNISITASGAVSINSVTATGGNAGSSSGFTRDVRGRRGGNILVKAASVVVNTAIDVSGNTGTYGLNENDGKGGNGGKGGEVGITATSGNIEVAEIITSGGAAAGNVRTFSSGGDAGTINLNLDVPTGNSIKLNGNLISNGGMGYVNSNFQHGNGGGITFTGNVILAKNILVDTLGFAGLPSAPGTDGAILFTANIIDDADAATRTLELTSGNSDTTVNGSVGVGAGNALESFTVSSAKNVNLNTITTLNGGISIEANETVTVTGIDTVNGGNAAGAVSITVMGLTTPSMAPPSVSLSGNVNAGALTIAAGGTISSAADLQSAQSVDISSTGGDVLLSSVNNQLSGDLSFSGNTVTLNNTVVTRLNNIMADTLNVTSTSGGILDIDAGAVEVTGVSTLNASAITLDGPGLNLTGLEVNNSNIVLVNNGGNALNVTSINASGLVDITSGALNATGDISGSSITLGAAGAALNTLNATNAVTITSTGLVVTGDISSGATFINAGDVSFNSITANTGGVTVSGDDIVQTGSLISEGNVVFSATDGFTMAVDANTTVNNGGLTVNATSLIGLRAVSVTNNVNINSSSDTINFNAFLNTTQGNITAVADQDVFMNGGLSGQFDIDLTATNGSYSQLAAINSIQGDISVTSDRSISMFTNSVSTATNGNIQYTARDNIGVTSLSATNGKIGISTATGAVTDTNGEAMNFVADILEIRSVNGIGATGQIETQVAKMDAINTGAGGIDFQQTGDIELIALQNTGTVGSVRFNSDADINLNPNSVVAARNQGLTGQGLLTMQTTQGSFFGLQQSNLNNPDITAQDAIILVRNGSFGAPLRPITMDVVNSVLIDARILFGPRFVSPGPAVVNTNGINFSLRGVVAAIASEQLVEVETLAEIDPAIFTDLQNYSSEEISIKMPQDQLFEDELDGVSGADF